MAVTIFRHLHIHPGSPLLILRTVEQPPSPLGCAGPLSAAPTVTPLVRRTSQRSHHSHPSATQDLSAQPPPSPFCYAGPHSAALTVTPLLQDLSAPHRHPSATQDLTAQPSSFTSFFQILKRPKYIFPTRNILYTRMSRRKHLDHASFTAPKFTLLIKLFLLRLQASVVPWRLQHDHGPRPLGAAAARTCS